MVTSCYFSPFQRKFPPPPRKNPRLRGNPFCRAERLLLLLRQTVVAALSYLVEDAVDLLLGSLLVGVIFPVGLLSCGLACVFLAFEHIEAAPVFAKSAPALALAARVLPASSVLSEAVAFHEGMLAPVLDEDVAEEHAAEVGQMGHAVVGGRNGREQFQGDGTGDYPLDLEGEGEGNDKHSLVGEVHTVGQEDAVECTRGAYCRPEVEQALVGPHHHHGVSEGEARHLFIADDVELYKLCQLLAEACAQAADDVIKKELPRSPIGLHHGSEHPQHKHVHEDMPEATMHEHVGEYLVEVEVRSQKKVQSQQAGQVYPHVFRHPGGDKHDGVDDQQILSDCGYFAREHFCSF